MSGMTREDLVAFHGQRTAALMCMTRASAIAALDDYHAAALACRGFYGRPEREREQLARSLDLARRRLEESAFADWVTSP